QNGKFANIYEFFERIPAGQINKRVVESLVIAGAFDEIDKYHRAQYFQPDTANKTTIERLLRYGQSYQENKNAVETSLFADFADEVQIEQPKISNAAEWANMYKLNKEKEIIGFYLSSHPLDEFKYQYQFVQGALSKKEILESKKNEMPPMENAVIPIDKDDDTTEEMEIEMGEDGEIIEEETAKNVEAKGSFNFLNLDEIDAFRDKTYGAEQLKIFEEIKDYKEKQRFNANAKEYMVAGLVTEYTIRDGYNSGEKVAFVTLEDYSGSYSFRLGDKDYLRLREKIDLQRFLIFKIKFTISKDSRVYLNVTDVIELKEVFDKFAKSLSVVVDINDLRK
ncbi:MAG: DNA polymerase III subunit alpha, partial [Bergeyella zoohelcum]|nr:DNA polymerase III subunit alpha [Bergeyella zoohelcum]